MSWENVAELVELAEECALAELGVFGSWDAMPDEREGVSVEEERNWILSGAVRDERFYMKTMPHFERKCGHYL